MRPFDPENVGSYPGAFDPFKAVALCALLALIMFVLTACAPVAVLPDVAKSQVTQASVVVTASCVTEIPAAPAWAADALPTNADEFQKTRALIAEHLQRKSYVPQLEAILAACK
jgi:hypothetical protein